VNAQVCALGGQGYEGEAIPHTERTVIVSYEGGQASARNSVLSLYPWRSGATADSEMGR